ncbi:IRGC [Symbiodinium pilosum]|uniref:IRGC protein n=1 Tax=Symbiodinium pilosum TaxID=2952 RepID=A0A812UAL0_SYMPI|nr:IRGC [Symbiodinium pilosum]
MPEEDLAREELLEALRKSLDDRGAGPLRAAAPLCDELKQLREVSSRLAQLQHEMLAQQDSLGAQREELARREAELKVQQLELEKQRRQSSCDISGSYPIPPWLARNSDGTMNVAVVGNSGVGKSLLINKMRRIRPGTAEWAPTGVKETTLRPMAYAFPQLEKVRLWDLPGAGTPGFPKDSYIRDMGLRYFDSVLIVTAGRFTSIDEVLRTELEDCGVPYFMVRTKVDLDIWNNREDNQIEEAATMESIRQELYRLHGVDRLYLVSSREPDRYDMPALLADAFPGVRARLEATSFLFTGQQIQKRLYIVDGTDVHITRDDGQTAIIQLNEIDDKVWFQDRWYIDLAPSAYEVPYEREFRSVGKAREASELRWIPGVRILSVKWLLAFRFQFAGVVTAQTQNVENGFLALYIDKVYGVWPFVWSGVKQLLDEARDYLESPHALQAFRSTISSAADRMPEQLAAFGGKASALKDSSVLLAVLFGSCVSLATSLLTDADGNGNESPAEVTIRSFADQAVVTQFCEVLYFQEPTTKK